MLYEHKKNKHYLETEHKIHQALLSLLNEAITPTISEICRRSNINRTTFYQHYPDIVALMENHQKSMNKEFVTDCQQSDLDISLMSYDSYVVFAQHIKKHKTFYRYFLEVNTNFPIPEEYDNLWVTVIHPYYLSIGLEDKAIMRLRFVCFQAGLTITMKKWIENGCNLSCEEVATILRECVTL